MTKKVLIIDNTIDRPWAMGADFLRYVDVPALVRRGPEEDLPKLSDSFSHIILSGSKTSCLDSSRWVLNLMSFLKAKIQEGVKVLGVCYGHQILSRTFGGDTSIQKSKTPEYGWIEIEQIDKNPILEGLPQKFYSFGAHLEEVTGLPSDFINTARSARCDIQAFYHKSKPIFGIQFHPERNNIEGEAGFLTAKKLYPKDCIFNEGRAKVVFDENIAITVFRNFIRV